MQKTQSKKINKKVVLLTAMSVLLTAILVLSGVGIYFKLTRKEKPTVEVNPLDFSYDTWDGTIEAVDFNEEYAGRAKQTKTINSAAAFVHFLNEVNGGNSFENYTVYLNSNIDLNGRTISSIGKYETAFKGTFDGGHYTILNAKVNGNGLFENTENATIKNVGLYNANVSLIHKAINTNVENCFVRLGKGKLINEVISNNSNHRITNSFVDSESKGLVGSVDTNNSSENTFAILNSYYTKGSSAIAERIGVAYVYENKTIKATNRSDFADWSYSPEYKTDKDWCNYDYLANSQKLDFVYPLQAGFVKVYLTGSCYESVVKSKNGSTIVDTTNLAEAFTEADKEETAEVNLLVEKIFMEARAEAESANVTINAVKDTTIVRGENNTDAMFVGNGTSKITLGTAPSVGTASGSNATTATLTLDGNREYVEKNNLDSGALVVANGGEVEIHDNVVIKNNVNNTTGYGGAVIVANAQEEMSVKATFENCSSTNGGGAMVVVSQQENVELKLGSFINCSTEGNGGGLSVVSELPAETVQQMRMLYGKNNTIQPMTDYTTNQTNVTIVEGDTFTGCTAQNGGALSSFGATIKCSVTFTSNHATGNGGAIYGNIVLRFQDNPDTEADEQAKFISNYADNDGGAIWYQEYLHLDDNTLFEGNGKNSSGTVVTKNGGAIYLQPIYCHEITGSPIFTSNAATTNGGAICFGSDFSMGETFTFSGSPEFTSNQAGVEGGAIYYDVGVYYPESEGYESGDRAELVFTGAAKFKSNNVGIIGDDSSSSIEMAGGGAIFATGDIEISGTASFEGCYATTCRRSDLVSANCYGGAIYCGRNLKLSNVASFTNNYSDGYCTVEGGAIYAAGIVDVDASAIFTSNSVEYGTDAGYAFRGGAICASTVNINANSQFISNHGIAGDELVEGGAIYASTSVNITKSPTFDNNYLREYGGYEVNATKRGSSISTPDLTITGSITIKNYGNSLAKEEIYFTNSLSLGADLNVSLVSGSHLCNIPQSKHIIVTNQLVESYPVYKEGVTIYNSDNEQASSYIFEDATTDGLEGNPFKVRGYAIDFNNLKSKYGVISAVSKIDPIMTVSSESVTIGINEGLTSDMISCSVDCEGEIHISTEMTVDGYYWETYDGETILSSFYAWVQEIGTYDLTFNFTPNDTETYNSVSKTIQVICIRKLIKIEGFSFGEICYDRIGYRVYKEGTMQIISSNENVVKLGEYESNVGYVDWEVGEPYYVPVTIVGDGSTIISFTLTPTDSSIQPQTMEYEVNLNREEPNIEYSLDGETFDVEDTVTIKNDTKHILACLPITSAAPYTYFDFYSSNSDIIPLNVSDVIGESDCAATCSFNVISVGEVDIIINIKPYDNLNFVTTTKTIHITVEALNEVVQLPDVDVEVDTDDPVDVEISASSGKAYVTLSSDKDAVVEISQGTQTIDGRTAHFAVNSGESISVAEYLRAVGAGTATITAEIYDTVNETTYYKTFTIVVEEGVKAVVTLTNTPSSAKVGQKVAFKYKSDYAGTFTITSNNSTLATVLYTAETIANLNYDALVEAVGVGTATITVAFVPADSSVKAPSDQTFDVVISAVPQLETPSNFRWTKNANGIQSVATWDAVSYEGVQVSYLVEWMGQKGSVLITTSNTSYDFESVFRSEIIDRDSILFNVTAISGDQSIVKDSNQSTDSGSIDATYTTLTKGTGVEKILVNGVECYEYVVIGDETPTISAVMMEGYEFDHWDYDESDGTMDNPNQQTTQIKTFINDIVANGRLAKYVVQITTNNANYGSVNETRVLGDVNASITTNGSKLNIGGIVVTATPENDDEQYSYSFVGWTGVESTLTRNIMIMANFAATLKSYTINISVKEDSVGFGSVNNEQVTVPYGTFVTFDKNILLIGANEIIATPEANSEQYVYEFNGWEGTIEVVEGSTEILASFIRTVRKYKVTFAVNDSALGEIKVGDEIATSIIVDYDTPITHADNVITIDGKDYVATVKTAGSSEVYSFTGWEGVEEKVTGNMILTAVFSSDVITCTITINVNNSDYGKIKVGDEFVTSIELSVKLNSSIYVVDNILTIGDQHVSAIATSSNLETTYKFIEWEYTGSTVTGDMDIQAKFAEEARQYVVTITAENCSLSDGENTNTTLSVTVAYGAKVYVTENTITIVDGETTTVITATASEGYTFEKWIGVVGTVEGSITITASCIAN